MEDTHGKEIDLQKTTIKIPGANRPRIGKQGGAPALADTNRLNTEIANTLVGAAAPLSFQTPGNCGESHADPAVELATTNAVKSSNKRHRRIKSNHKSDQNKEDGKHTTNCGVVDYYLKQAKFV